MRILFALPIALAAAFVAVPADAAYLLTLTEANGGVTAYGVGSINTAGLGFNGRAGGSNIIIPRFAGILIGNTRELDQYVGDFARPTSFGSGGFNSDVAGNTGSGFGFLADEDGDVLLIERGYVSGTAIESRSIFRDTDFARLGVTPGTYVWNWGSGANADSFTLQIGAAAAGVPEPAAWAMMIGGFGVVGGSLRRQRAARPRVRFA